MGPLDMVPCLELVLQPLGAERKVRKKFIQVHTNGYGGKLMNYLLSTNSIYNCTSPMGRVGKERQTPLNNLKSADCSLRN
eukprot:2515580-Prymnesium_polylepis.1